MRLGGDRALEALQLSQLLSRAGSEEAEDSFERKERSGSSSLRDELPNSCQRGLASIESDLRTPLSADAERQVTSFLMDQRVGLQTGSGDKHRHRRRSGSPGYLIRESIDVVY